ncbi:MAG: exonuclease SbcCD subunit D [Gammaproteobacteria bacterium]|nr:exonuclease SbcCD subunit D [Gammaproteobacteria bacterium]MYE51352.1 exonuclease SbcCD subunit D [Gammaproteobacteria bacterium]
MVRFLHTADWQLGMTRHFLAGEAQARFDGARLDAIRAIGALAEKENCAFVVVCGDVFESNQVERQVIVRALDAMRATPQVTFYLLPGNHDPLDASTLYKSPSFINHRPDNVVVLECPDPVEAAPGIELIAAPWLTKRPIVDLVSRACAGLTADTGVRIVVGHGACDVLSPDKADPALISLSQLEENLNGGRIHYVALGDRHSKTDVGDSGRVWYSGAPEPTDYVEIDPGNVLLVALDANQVRVEPRSVGTWRFLRDERALTGDTDLDALDEWLSRLDSKDRTIVKLALVGQLSLIQKARLDDLLNHHADLLAALETWERRSELVVVPDDVDRDDLGLSGFALEAFADLGKLAESGEQAVVAREALALLYRLARTG